jgi:outer membrane immunogenic protein
MKVLLVFLSLLCFSATVSQAQPAKSWSGFHAGVNIGAVSNSSNAQTSTVDASEGYFNTTSVPVIATAGNQDPAVSRFVGGGLAGYDFQFSRFVVGGEADFGSMSFSQSATATAIYPCCAPTSFTITQSVSADWLTTQRGRLGYAPSDKFLIYGSAGAGETNFQYTSVFTDTFASALETAHVSQVKAGWVGGGGMDVALSRRFFLSVEYFHANFGTVSSAGDTLTTVASDGGGGGGGGGSPTVITRGLVKPHVEQTDSWPASTFSHKASLTSNFYRVGINFRF